MTERASNLLLEWIVRQTAPEPARWFEEQIVGLKDAQSSRSLDILFGLIPRKLGKEDLQLSGADLAAANAVRPGWNPSKWSVDVAARVLVLCQLSAAPESNQTFAQRFKDIHRTADLGELLALYHGLPLYDHGDTLVDMAALGLRTNIRSEFEAIAHRNPFPSEQFDQNPWNNMVLKALFIGALLEPIQGLDARANPDLARILRDYAHERWAADRIVSPELWRCIGPFATNEYLDDFQKVVDIGQETEKKAVALALRTSPDSDKKSEIAAQLRAFDAGIDTGEITWASLADEMFDNSLAITRKLNTEVEMTR